MFVFQSALVSNAPAVMKLDLSDPTKGAKQAMNIKNFLPLTLNQIVEYANQHLNKLYEADRSLVKPASERQMISISYDGDGQAYLNMDKKTSGLYTRFYNLLSKEEVFESFRIGAVDIFKTKEFLGEEKFNEILQKNNGNFTSLIKTIKQIYRDNKAEISKGPEPDKGDLSRFVNSLVCLLSAVDATYAASLTSEVKDLNILRIGDKDRFTPLITTLANTFTIFSIMHKASSQGLGMSEKRTTSGGSAFATLAPVSLLKYMDDAVTQSKEENKETTEFIFGKGAYAMFSGLAAKMLLTSIDYLEQEGASSQPSPGFIASSTIRFTEEQILFDKTKREQESESAKAKKIADKHDRA